MMRCFYKQVHHDSGYTGMCEVWTLYLPASCTSIADPLLP
jgi:hypothetical protein